MNSLVKVEIDHLKWYVSIEILGFAKHWLALEGAYWTLNTGNSFNKPLKKWLESKSIYSIVADAISIITKDANK